MSDAGPLLQQIATAAADAGLILRGAFHPEPTDAVPPLGGDRPAATLVMLGNAGPDLWRAFSASPEFGDGDPHPLDRWTRRIVGGLAGRLGAQALFPFGGPPYHPFQRWAMRADSVAPSPLGILIHPDFGLWHAYRAALAFDRRLGLPPREDRRTPCGDCAGRPCLSACPVGAFTNRGYDVAACARHLESAAGTDCVERGCRARRACPIGVEFQLRPGQAAFHMRAFRAARR